MPDCSVQEDEAPLAQVELIVVAPMLGVCSLVLE